jgi:hypothetical protein
LSPTDADGDTVNLQAVVSATGPAAALQRQLGLYFNGSYYQGLDGLGEKWLYSATKQQWYVVLPDGEVRPGKTATNPATDVATLDASAWQDPSLIFAPPLPNITATIVGNTLTLGLPDNFRGTYQVGLTASDGVQMGSQSFLLSRQPADLGPIPTLPAPTNTFVANPVVMVDFLAFTAPGYTASNQRTFFTRDSQWTSGVGGVAFGSRDANGNLEIIVGTGPGQFSAVRLFASTAASGLPAGGGTTGMTPLAGGQIFTATPLFYQNLFATPLATQFQYLVGAFSPA